MIKNDTKTEQTIASQRDDLEQAYTDNLNQLKVLKKNNQSYKKKLKKMVKLYRQALHCANHDDLTGLPGRRLFEDRLKLAAVQSARHQKPVALLFLDLDKFKNINDTFGHVIGDQILQQVAQRLTSSIRRGDTVCRYGGDEFIVLLPDMDGEGNSGDLVIDKIRHHLSQPYRVNNLEITLAISIGMTTFMEDDLDKQDLIQRADIAMYRNKKHHQQEQKKVIAHHA
jgi:diguanylate cyclase (GGDEF)-like protein